MDGPGRLSVARLQVLAAAAIFSTGGAAIKAASVSGWQVAALRSGIAALALLLLLPGARRGWGWRPLLVGVAHAATMILFVLANKLTTSANTIFLQSTAPLWVVLLSPLLLGERVRARDLGLMAVMAGGMGLFFLGVETPRATAPDPVTGNVLAALSGVSWAFTIVGLRWMGRTESGNGSGTAAAVVFGNVFACLACLPAALPLVSLSSRDWIILGFLGVVQIGFAYALLTFAFRHVPALEVSLLVLAEPVLNPIWSWLAHGERPGPWSLAGGAVILAATLVQALRSRRT